MCGYEKKSDDRGHGKIKCNKHEIRSADSFKYLESKIIIYGNVLKKLQK